MNYMYKNNDCWHVHLHIPQFEIAVAFWCSDGTGAMAHVLEAEPSEHIDKHIECIYRCEAAAAGGRVDGGCRQILTCGFNRFERFFVLPFLVARPLWG